MEELTIIIDIGTLNREIVLRAAFAVIVVIAFLLYPLLNKRGENAHIIKLWIDDWIPFAPLFSIPYILYIPFLLITLGYFIFFTDIYKSISISFIFCLFVASLFYYFYQTTVPRPEISGTDIFSKLVVYIYSKDEPYNCFPSLHTTLSILSFLYWIQLFPNLKWSIGAFVLSIVLSTVLLKQHYIPDVISGIILGFISFYVPTCILQLRLF